MPLKTYQIPAPLNAPDWFTVWQVQLAKALADISMQLAQARGQDGNVATFSNILDASGNRIKNVGTPTNPTDAATKKNVDDVVDLVGQLPALRQGEGIVISRKQLGDILISVRTPTRVGPTGTPGSFSADYYVLLHDVAGNSVYIPAMATSW